MVELTQSYLSIANAARLLPGKPSPSAVWRWVRSGVNGVKLPAIKVGSRFFINEADLAGFIQHVTEMDRERFEAARAARQAEQAAGKAARPRPASEKRRQREINEAMENLRKAGVKC